MRTRINKLDDLRLSAKGVDELLWPWLHLMNSRKFPSRMKGIQPAEPNREIPLCRIRRSNSKNKQLAREIL